MMARGAPPSCLGPWSAYPSCGTQPHGVSDVTAAPTGWHPRAVWYLPKPVPRSPLEGHSHVPGGGCLGVTEFAHDPRVPRVPRVPRSGPQSAPTRCRGVRHAASPRTVLRADQAPTPRQRGHVPAAKWPATYRGCAPAAPGGGRARAVSVSGHLCSWVACRPGLALWDPGALWSHSLSVKSERGSGWIGRIQPVTAAGPVDT